MLNLRKVADDADMIVNGYAFNKCSHGYRVLNLNKPQNAIVFSKSGEIIEKPYKKKKRRQPPTETGEGSDVFLYLFYKRLPSGLQAKLINKFLSFALGTPIPGAHGIQELL